jgi:LacI family transcriptional regulator
MLMDSGQELDGEIEALRTLLNHQVDGLLLSTVGISEAVFDEIVMRRGTPCVFFDSMIKGAGAGAVTLDNVAGIDLLVDHLVWHGHRRIGILAGSLDETSGLERLDAFRAAVDRHGLPGAPELVRVCRWTQEEGQRATLELLAADPAPTAVVASSAELAVGCLAACRERGLRLPDELAIACFDDPYFGALLEPALTAVAYDPGTVGRSAATLLVEAMKNENGTRLHTVPVQLVRRRSCGCEEP